MAGYIGSKGSGIISGIGASIADLNLTDKASANGTTEANKVLTADGNKDVTAIRNLTATGDVTATGTVTRALTRGSIDVGNSSGVSSALAKGAAGTVLTSDGTDLSFVAASGGGEQTFTATGAISAGDIVGFNPNGTISSASVELQTAVDLGATEIYSAVYDTGNDKVVFFLYDANYNISARVGTISNGQISLGTAVALGIAGYYVSPAYDANSGKIVIVYRKVSDNDSYAVVATVSGTSISFGTPVLFNASTSYSLCIAYDSNAQKVLVTYNGNGDYPRARVGTVSGTSISFGTELAYTNLAGAPLGGSLVFDSNANKFLSVYPRVSAYDLICTVLTISGTNVTAGTAISASGYNNSGKTYSTFIPTLNKIFLTLLGGYRMLTISGTNVSSVQLTITGYNSSGSYLTMAGDKQLLTYNNGGSTSVVEVTVSATSVEFAPASTIFSFGTAPSSRATIYDPDTSRLVFTDKTNAYVYNPESPKFVGIAKEDITNGATGKITVVGGVNTSVSGLTAGKNYGKVASSASLTEIGVSEVGAVGVALSSSSIYLNKGKS
tara:strand:+ start:3213 stop:4874 length:1662 start_codon:yes stop_codon:yes gene_type:complete